MEGTTAGVKREYPGYDNPGDGGTPVGGFGDESVIITKRARGEGPKTELRFLIISKDAGAIIGKGGELIKRLRSEYEAQVQVPDCPGPERMLKINTALGSGLAIVKEVLSIIAENHKEPTPEDEHEIRFLIHQSQVGCIIGKGGTKIKELRGQCNVSIKVFQENCPHSTDRIISVRGNPDKICTFLSSVYDMLQVNVPKGPQEQYRPENFDEYFATEYGGYTAADSFGTKGGGGGEGRGRGGDRGRGRGGGFRGGRGRSRGAGAGGWNAPDSGPWKARGGMSRGGAAGPGGLTGDNMAFGSGNFFGGDMTGMSMNDLNEMGFGSSTSAQVSIPNDVAGAVIGKGGARINMVRQQSGASVQIDDCLPGEDQRVITITGNPYQIRAAQTLLQMNVRQYSGKY